MPVFGASILGHFPPENRPFFSAVAYPRTAGSRCAAPYLSKTPRFQYTISATPRGRGQPRRMEPAASAQGPLATSDGRQWGFTCQSASAGSGRRSREFDPRPAGQYLCKRVSTLGMPVAAVCVAVHTGWAFRPKRGDGHWGSRWA